MEKTKFNEHTWIYILEWYNIVLLEHIGKIFSGMKHVLKTFFYANNIFCGVTYKTYT